MESRTAWQRIEAKSGTMRMRSSPNVPETLMGARRAPTIPKPRFPTASFGSRRSPVIAVPSPCRQTAAALRIR